MKGDFFLMTKSKNQTQAPGLATELMGLIALDSGVVEARIRSLNLAEFVGVMRSLRKLEDALVKHGDQWKDAYCWGRGAEFPAV